MIHNIKKIIEEGGKRFNKLSKNLPKEEMESISAMFMGGQVYAAELMKELLIDVLEQELEFFKSLEYEAKCAKESLFLAEMSDQIDYLKHSIKKAKAFNASYIRKAWLDKYNNN
jgi:hypothetical protein